MSMYLKIAHVIFFLHSLNYYVSELFFCNIQDVKKKPFNIYMVDSTHHTE